MTETSNSKLTLSHKLSASDRVLCQEMSNGEAVFLNLDSTQYHGADEVGAEMWRAIRETESLADALRQLEESFDADKNVLEADLLEFAETLVNAGLLIPTPPAA